MEPQALMVVKLTAERDQLAALLDELEAALAELEALKVPLAIYERRTKAIGAAEELEELIGNWRNLRLADYLPKRIAQLRKEANGTRPTNKNCT